MLPSRPTSHSRLSSNFPALWPAAKCHFLTSRRCKLFSLYLFIEPLFSPGRILVIFCVVCFGSQLREPSQPFNGWLLALNGVVSLPLEREPQTLHSQDLLTRTQVAAKNFKYCLTTGDVWRKPVQVRLRHQNGHTYKYTFIDVLIANY